MPIASRQRRRTSSTDFRSGARPSMPGPRAPPELFGCVALEECPQAISADSASADRCMAVPVRAERVGRVVHVEELSWSRPTLASISSTIVFIPSGLAMS